MLLSIRNVKSIIKMRWFAILIAAVCVIFLFKQRWPKNKRSRSSECLSDTEHG